MNTPTDTGGNIFVHFFRMLGCGEWKHKILENIAGSTSEIRRIVTLLTL